jgi:hypothetical protein
MPRSARTFVARVGVCDSCGACPVPVAELPAVGVDEAELLHCICAPCVLLAAAPLGVLHAALEEVRHAS